jgi:hypothetical protein
MKTELSHSEEQARNAEVKKKIQKALALLPGFKVQDDLENDWDCRVDAVKEVDGPNAVKLYASFSAGYGDKRIHVSGIYPRNCKNEYIRPYYTQEERAARKAEGLPEYNYGEVEPPKISISPDKTPEQIAKDIIRRLLPGVFDYHARVMARIDQDNDYHARSENTLAEIKKEFNGGAPDQHEIERKMFSAYIPKDGEEYGSRFEVKTSRESVDLEISSLTASEAIMVIRAVKEIRGVK